MSSSSFTHFVFVDFENVPSVDLALVKGKPVHVTLLIGKKQTKINTELAVQFNDFASQVTPLPVSASGHNALDMILTSCLTEAVGRNPAARFSIVSKDGDFDPIVSYFCEKQVSITRHHTFASAFAEPHKKPTTATAAPAKKPARNRFAELVEKMKTSPNHRPKNRDALLHHITAFYGKDLPATGAEGVIRRLEAEGRVRIDDKGRVSCL